MRWSGRWTPFFNGVSGIFIGTLYVPALLLLAACSQPLSTNESIVTDYIQATNEKDLEHITALMHEDIEWIQITGSEQQIMAGGRDALLAEIKSMMDSGFEATSALSDIADNGRFVTAIETVSYTRKNGEPATQSANSVYEIEDGIIRRVWYYPAVKP